MKGLVSLNLPRLVLDELKTGRHNLVLICSASVSEARRWGLHISKRPTLICNIVKGVKAGIVRYLKSNFSNT